MKLITLIFLMLFVQINLHSQSCLPSGKTFNTQEQIDNFQSNYPNCTEIEGDVEISGWGIENLSGLNVLTAIWGDLIIGNWVYGNPLLTTLSGLENLSSVGGDLLISHNEALINISDLGNLEHIGNTLRIEYNSELINLEGLEKISSIHGNLSIGPNFSITSLQGLNQLTDVEGHLEIFGNEYISNLTGLENVISVGGNLDVWSNLELTSLAELEQLNSVGGRVYFYRNDLLQNLSGINLQAINGNLIIDANYALEDLSGLENLQTIGGILNIEDNNALINMNGLENLNSISGDLIIENNESMINMNSLENLNFIGGNLKINYNDNLTSLTGLANIDANSIHNLSIIDNPLLSACSAGSICDYLSAPNGVVEINNNNTGCNNPSQIANDCGFAMPCLPYGSYYFFTQQEIDEFQMAYPNCHALNGLVQITGDSITNLSGLSVIDTVSGILNIWHNASLTNLNGLENLSLVGDRINICYNSTLSDLSGIKNIDMSSLNKLDISGNAQLSICAHESICDYLTNPSAYATFFNNAPGCSSYSEVTEACQSISVEENDNLPYCQLHCIPNPVYSSTNICVVLNEPCTLKLRIFDFTGREIKELHSGSISAGTHYFSWDAGNYRKGAYLLKLQADGMIKTKTIVLIK